MEVCQLADADATLALGRRLAKRLLEGGATCQLLLLQGELGAGKTCLVQGLAEGLGISEPITSPTFALAHHYRGEVEGKPTALVHLDLYRLEQPASAAELFAQEEEEARTQGAVLAVEWPQRLAFVPMPCWRVELEFAGGGRLARLHAPEIGETVKESLENQPSSGITRGLTQGQDWIDGWHEAGFW